MFSFIFFLLILAFCIFSLVLMYKSLQFTLTATSLYKKIIKREDLIIKLLLDIRDGTKEFKLDDIKQSEKMIDQESSHGSTVLQSEESGPTCPECQQNNTYYDYNGDLFCRNCLKITLKKETIPDNKE